MKDRSEYQKVYRQNNLERLKNYDAEREKTRVPTEHQNRLKHLRLARDRANKSGIPFDLEVKDIDWVDVCPILKIKLVRGWEDTKSSPTLDKVIPSLGYVKGNVRVISRLANLMKNNANPEEIAMFCKNIKKYLEGKL